MARAAISAVVVTVCVARTLAVLFRRRRDLAAADIIVVMHEGGFGHTISGPDIARRLYAGKRCVFVIFERSQHNTLAATLWTDILVLYVPFRIRAVRRFGIPEIDVAAPVRQRVAALLLAALKMVTHSQTLHLADLVRALRSVRHVHEVERRYSSHWLIPWSVLIESVTAPEPRLPASVADRVWSAIESYAGPAAQRARADRKVCCLYIRDKGGPSTDLSSVRRSGGPLSLYLPTISQLGREGYLVLLTGDQRPEREALGSAAQHVVSASWLGGDDRAFALFAATECDIWIGNSGGGVIMPVARRVPMLVLNTFPFGSALPWAWMHYKHACGPDGRLTPPAELVREHAYDHEMVGYEILEGPPAELEATVSEFLEQLDGPRPPSALAREFMAALPAHALLRYLNGRISETWLSAQNSHAEPAGGLQ